MVINIIKSGFGKTSYGIFRIQDWHWRENMVVVFTKILFAQVRFYYIIIYVLLLIMSIQVECEPFECTIQFSIHIYYIYHVPA